MSQVEVLSQELQSAKEANEKAPSKTMKGLVERLRNQLAKKEKEQKVCMIPFVFDKIIVRKVEKKM